MSYRVGFSFRRMFCRMFFLENFLSNLLKKQGLIVFEKIKV